MYLTVLTEIFGQASKPWYLTLIFALVHGLATGLIVALAAVALAFRRHKNQQWWNKKFEAFDEVIKAFSIIRRYYWLYIEHEENQNDYIKNEIDKMMPIYKEAKETLYRYSETGGYILSTQATNILFQFDRDLAKAENEPGNIFMIVDRSYGVAKSAHKKIIDHARKELKIKKND